VGLYRVGPGSVGRGEAQLDPVLFQSNAQDLWIGPGRGASRNAEGVPSRVID
jgi:hypothetical protein